MRAWRGLKALTHDAVDFTTELVREGHESSARAVMRVLGAIEPIAETAKGVDQARRVVTDGVLGTIRAANRAVEGITDAALDELEQALSRRSEPSEPSPTAALPLRSDLLGSLPWLGDGPNRASRRPQLRSPSVPICSAHCRGWATLASASSTARSATTCTPPKAVSISA